MTLDIDEVLGAVVANRTTVPVCLRGDLLAEHERLQAALVEAVRYDQSSNEHDRAPAVARELHELEQQIHDAEVPFTFVAIGQQPWTDLQVKHLPTADDAKEGYGWNPRTFPAAAIAAACIAPAGVTVAKAEQLAKALSFGQWMKLWSACLQVNVGGGDAPFSLAASVVLHGSETRSELPGTTESPVLSS